MHYTRKFINLAFENIPFCVQGAQRELDMTIGYKRSSHGWWPSGIIVDEKPTLTANHMVLFENGGNS